MPDGHWRATHGTMNGTHVPNGVHGKKTTDLRNTEKAYPEKVEWPKVVCPEWGELTLEKARGKLVRMIPALSRAIIFVTR